MQGEHSGFNINSPEKKKTKKHRTKATLLDSYQLKRPSCDTHRMSVVCPRACGRRCRKRLDMKCRKDRDASRPVDCCVENV